jgi:hypothetical protein
MRRCLKSTPGLLNPLIVVMLFSACIRQEVDLSFETIEKEVGTKLGVERYEEKEPKLVIVSTFDDIPSLSPNISPEAQPELNNTDFGEYFLIAVFQGWKAVYDYEVSIERIAYLGETVKVFAEFVEPTEGQMLHPAVSSPYHVVRVEKPQELAGKEVRFILIANGQEVTSEMHRLP